VTGGKFVCQKCGKCCREIPINLCASDINRWLSQKRSDILMEVSWINNYPHAGTGGFYIAKTAFAPKQVCPFLVGNLCNIWDTRPRACADFPHGHSVWKGCPAWEKIGYARDLKADTRARKIQHRDFKTAHEGRDYLVMRVIEGRRTSNG